ncbi:MAG: hypothetical protein QOE64_575 [Frankiales bacterium]|jgi:hypothetical protein|nr:hypothetical protein [Frankiales bacterium]
MRRLLAGLACGLLTLVVADTGARSVADRLPPPNTWFLPEAQEKQQRIETLAATSPDVALVGSSVVDRGIRARTMSTAGIPAYNAALGGGNAQLTAHWLQDVVLPELHPHVIVIGLMARDLNDHFQSPVREYLRSEGRLLQTGRAGFWLRQKQRLERISGLARLRPRLDEAYGGQDPGAPESASRNDRFGDLTFFDDRVFRAPNERRRAGLKEVFARFEMTRTLTVVRKALEGARHQGVTIVLVDMPSLEQDIATYLPAGEQPLIHEALRQLAADTGAVYVDGFEGIPAGRTAFADEYHLNGIGARILTEHVIAVIRKVG